MKQVPCITCGEKDAKYVTITLEPDLKEPPAFEGFLCEACRTLLATELRATTEVPVEVVTVPSPGLAS